MYTNPTIEMISIENIIPNRFQPRLSFDEKALNELSASIKEHGIIQPIVLRKLGDKYEIIAGERRYKAATMAGLTEVPAIISTLDDNESAEVALVENIQRKDLTSIEEARSYKKILDKGYINQEELAQKMGVSQSTVANKLRLLNLTQQVQDALLNNKISERHARSLLQIKDEDKQVEMLHKTITERLTVRQLDKEIKEETETEVNLIEEPVETLDLTSPPKEESLENLDNINTPLTPTPNIFNIFEQKEYPSLEDEEVNLSITNIYDKEDNIIEEDNLEIVDFAPKETIKIKEPEVERIKKDDPETIKNAYQDLEKEIIKAGYKITSESFDFEDLYQIIIKIEKDIKKD